MHTSTAQPIEIDASGHSLTRYIGGVPTGCVKAAGPLAIHQCRYALPEDVEHLQPHVYGRR